MNRLKEARKAKKLTQTQVAAHMGIGQSCYSDWERGRVKIDSGSLARLAELFGCTADWLLGRDPLPADARPYTSGTRIPVLGTVVAGIPLEAVQDIVDYEEIDGKLAAAGTFFALQVRGDSMEPRMREGDVVIVRRQDTADTGDTVVALVGGEAATIKKLKLSPGGLTLLPSNPAYDPLYYTADEVRTLPVTILGRVVELRAKF